MFELRTNDDEALIRLRLAPGDARYAGAGCDGDGVGDGDHCGGPDRRDAGALRVAAHANSIVTWIGHVVRSRPQHPALIEDGTTWTTRMPLIEDAVRARASVGEISDVLRGVWGQHQPSTVF